MNTDVTTQSIAEKIRTRVIPMTLIGVGFSVVAAAGLLFWNQPLKPTPKTAPSVESLTASLKTKISDFQLVAPATKSVAVSEIKNLAEQRKPLMKSLLRSNPTKFMALALPDVYLQKSPLEVHDLIEQTATVTGRVNITHADNFSDPSRSVYTTFLVTPEEQPVEIVMMETGAAPLVAQSTVTVSGVRLDNTIVPLSASVDSASSASVTTATIRNTLMIMVKFPDTGTPAEPTVAQVQNLFFNQTRGFYQENSYGNLDISGTIAKNGPTTQGWILMPNNSNSSTYCNEIGGLNTIVRDSVMAAQALDPALNLGPYTNINLVGPITCGWGGLASIGDGFILLNTGTIYKGISYVQSNVFTNVNHTVYAHEFGHTLGVGHATMYKCTGTSCYYEEYGDLYDAMGGPYYPRHFNAPHKEHVQWLDAASLPLVTTNGTYVIQPIESTSGVRAIKIQRATNDFLYVENRQPTVNGQPTLDAGMNIDQFNGQATDVFSGALLHSIRFGTSSSTALLDPTHPPGDPADNVYSSALPVCLSPADLLCQYSDPLTHSIVRVLSRNAAGALNVQVTIGKNDFSAPSISLTLSPPFLSGIPYYGGSILLQATATDPSGISKVDFFRVIPGSSALIGTVTTAPYNFNYNINSLPGGSETVYAVAYDRAGESYGVPNNKQSSLSRNFSVDNTFPTVNITAPAQSATVSGSVTIAVTAYDNVSVARVEMYANNQLIGSSLPYPAPAPTDWSMSWNTAALAPGSYQLVAKAFDIAGNTTTSAVVNVTVSSVGGGGGACGGLNDPECMPLEISA